MTNSRLIAYLKSLNKGEMRDLGRFIQASKGTKDVSALYQYLQKYHPQFPEKNILKETVVKKLFPNEANITKKFTNILYKFGQLLDGFLVQEELKAKKVERDFLLLHALKRRQLDPYFFKKAEQIEEDWNDNPPPGLEQLHNRYRLREMYHTHQNYPLIKKAPISPKDFINDIDTYYFATKLYWALHLRHNENYLTDLNDANKAEYLLDEILELSQSLPFVKVPQVRLTASLLKAFIQNNFNNYQNLKEEFIQHFNLYNEYEKYNIVYVLFSACYQNYKLGKLGALEQLFGLSCLMIENGFLITNQKIHTDQFLNIINIGFALNKLDWTEKFIKDYGKLLSLNEQEDVLAICNARIHYHKGDFEGAIQKLATVKFQNILYGLQARSIQLKSYYELGESYYPMFWSLTKSFYLFLSRNTLSEETKLQFKNFIAFTKKMQTIKSNPKKFISEDLKRKLNENHNIANKSWLTIKLGELQMIMEKQAIH